MSTTGPLVSIVIPTFKRDESLKRLLERLTAQQFRPEQFEIIVVDDARSRSTPAAVAEVAARHPEIAISSLPGRSRGPATARNIGWRAAHGEIIAFIDDDAYPRNDRWLCEGCAPFADPTVAGVGGAVQVPVDEPPTDFQRNVKGLESGSFITCNAFYRREALARVNGFDERFLLPYREDSDLQYRVQAGDGRLVCNPNALVIHPAPPGRFAVSLRLQRYSLYNALIYKKHRRRYRAELEPHPPLHYYAVLGSGVMALVALLRGRTAIGAFSGVVWALLEWRFFSRRVRGTSHRPLHLLDMALTSLLIPPLSVYWRLRGAVRFRVPFV
jgi:glycosyltransferase involved in cell wall biosynthesis